MVMFVKTLMKCDRNCVNVETFPLQRFKCLLRNNNPGLLQCVAWSRARLCLHPSPSSRCANCKDSIKYDSKYKPWTFSIDFISNEYNLFLYTVYIQSYTLTHKHADTNSPLSAVCCERCVCVCVC